MSRNGRKTAIYESQILVISLYIIQDKIRTQFFGQNNLRNRGHIDNISFPGAKHETLSSRWKSRTFNCYNGSWNNWENICKIRITVVLNSSVHSLQAPDFHTFLVPTALKTIVLYKKSWHLPDSLKFLSIFKLFAASIITGLVFGQKEGCMAIWQTVPNFWKKSLLILFSKIIIKKFETNNLPNIDLLISGHEMFEIFWLCDQ